MAEHPWLSIIGLGEDGLDGLACASLAALEQAEIIMGPPRHLSLLPEGTWETREWPIPFADGIGPLLALRGRMVAVLVSGDPFWFGAGSVLAREMQMGEWQAFPAPSVFSQVAARLGWALETTLCMGLHAAPVSRLRPHLAPGARIIVLLRDGQAVGTLASTLIGAGFGDSRMTVCQALGGSREKISEVSPAEASERVFQHPVCAALEIKGAGEALPLASGLPDALFAHDGQITKRPVRAMTLSALAPKHGEHLWDIGGGSGSISIEWLLADPSLRATTIEVDAPRAARIRENAMALGVDRLQVITGRAPAVLEGLGLPDVVFVGGGLSADLLERLISLGSGVRLVANAVTLEAETLLTDARKRLGGSLMRMDFSSAEPLGTKTGWRSSFPVVQWSVTL